jgi:hypothetical protein
MWVASALLPSFLSDFTTDVPILFVWDVFNVHDLIFRDGEIPCMLAGPIIEHRGFDTLWLRRLCAFVGVRIPKKE